MMQLSVDIKLYAGTTFNEVTVDIPADLFWSGTDVHNHYKVLYEV